MIFLDKVFNSSCEGKVVEGPDDEGEGERRGFLGVLFIVVMVIKLKLIFISMVTN